jgi:hypothetical protein
VVQPAVIGWEAKYRRIDLVIERTLKGEELVRRMKGWITVDPNDVIETVRKYGKLRVIDDWELVVDLESMNEFSGLQQACSDAFGDQVDIDLINE